MKKLASIFAVVVMSAGLFTSCESETNVDDSDALYEVEVNAAVDGTMLRTTQRE